MSAPLDGLRLVELAAIGPVPHATALLIGLGADVVRVQRPRGGNAGVETEPYGSFRRGVVTADLKLSADRDAVLELIDLADVVLEGFRPGVMERLGLAPETCLARNPRLIYGRMTGWGQSGPRSARPGHDINYIGLTGALHAIGTSTSGPVPPLNLLGDYGGGSMHLLIGVLSALHERTSSGCGQIVDASIVDGTIGLMAGMWARFGAGSWIDSRASNLLDTGAPFYDTYECGDGKHVAVGALEPQFYKALIDGLGLADRDLPEQLDQSGWPALRGVLTEAFKSRTRDEWDEHFRDTDACVTPVLSLAEAAVDPHIEHRDLLQHSDDAIHVTAHPRLSRSVVSTAPGSLAAMEMSAAIQRWTSAAPSQQP